MSRYVLRLYVGRRTAEMDRSIANLRRRCERELSEGCDLAVIDVQQQPELAHREQVLVTPTLVKVEPLPSARWVGGLSEIQQFLPGLGSQMPPASETSPPGAS